jgi:Domain of unknown function (DUF4188)
VTTILRQRMTATLDEDAFVVFLIGARFNRLWKIRSVFRVARAMTKMMAELKKKPELGFLGAEEYFGRTSLMVQYWKSLQHLLDYAHARDSVHLPAWREFNREVAASADVGIWHETYVIQPGSYENIYHNMPAFGLGRAGSLNPVGQRRGKSTELASDRLQANQPAPGAEEAERGMPSRPQDAT